MKIGDKIIFNEDKTKTLFTVEEITENDIILKSDNYLMGIKKDRPVDWEVVNGETD